MSASSALLPHFSLQLAYLDNTRVHEKLAKKLGNVLWLWCWGRAEVAHEDANRRGRHGCRRIACCCMVVGKCIVAEVLHAGWLPFPRVGRDQV